MQSEVSYTSRVFGCLRLVGTAVLLAVSVPVFAQSCPANESKMCFGGSCFCVPPLNEETLAKINAAKGPLLEMWLTDSRNESYLDSAPIPPKIREALTGYISEDALNRARFVVTDPNKAEHLNLGDMTILLGERVKGYDIEAITLIDVIVFRKADDAQNNAKLWAHELTHVQQFADWGVAEFANRYVVDFISIEDEASHAADAYVEWVNSKLTQ